MVSPTRLCDRGAAGHYFRILFRSPEYNENGNYVTEPLNIVLPLLFLRAGGGQRTYFCQVMNAASSGMAASG